MANLNDSEHDKECLTCECYDTKKKQLFRIYRMKAGEQTKDDHFLYSVIAFVLEGVVRVSTGIYLKVTVGHSNMFVIHKGDNGYMRCIEDAVVLFCGFDSSMALCNGLSLNNSVNLPPPTPKQRIMSGLPYLYIQKLLMVELNITVSELESKLLGLRFMELKRFLILMLIRTLYNKEDLFYMFRSVQSDDFDFREDIFKYYTYDVNAQQLCALMGMSTATFNRKFKKAFGLPVGKWINAKRKINVLIDLKTTDMTIKDIAAKYNLTPNYLTNFCKKQLGNVPANIRRGEVS